MVKANQLNPGVTVSIRGELYRVESAVKVTVPKGTPFIKVKMRNLSTDKVSEKNFNPDQDVKDVELLERQLEFLYLEGKDYLFLDINSLEMIPVPIEVIGERINFLKEGIGLKAAFYGDTVFSVELPQFLELMVVEAEGGSGDLSMSNTTKKATLETGAQIEVPPFIEAGDIVKVDTHTEEYIQRI
jgi:elongation factor P